MSVALQDVYKDQGLNADGTFSCKHWPNCLASQKPGTVQQYSGSTAGLTPFYDVWYRGQPLRVLIVGKERSYDSGLKYGVAPNVNARSWQCLYTIQSHTRTNHIKGTLLTLQWIFEVASDNLCACYALSNILRCGFQRQEAAENTSDLQHNILCLHSPRMEFFA